MSNLPNPADVFGDDHPIIGEAVAWLEATDTVPLSRRMAENLLPHWPHYPNLSDRERAGILARFPETVSEAENEPELLGELLTERHGEPDSVAQADGTGVSTGLPEALQARAEATEAAFRRRLDAHSTRQETGLDELEAAAPSRPGCGRPAKLLIITAVASGSWCFECAMHVPTASVTGVDMLAPGTPRRCGEQDGV